MNTSSPISAPGAVPPRPGLNTASMVIGGLGLVAIGALAAVLLMGQRSAPTPTEAAPVVAAPASMPAMPAEPPAPVAAVAAPPAPVAEPAPTPRPAAKPTPRAAAPTAHTAPPPTAPTAPVAAPPADNTPLPGVRTEAAAPPEPAPPPPKPVCTNCGVISEVTPVEQKGEGSGLGAVAGGVLGGVLGHQVGGGRGKDVATVIGAIGGGLAGHEVEKRQRSTTLYQVQVRMDDGSRRMFTRETAYTVGQRVRIEGENVVLDTNGSR